MSRHGSTSSSAQIQPTFAPGCTTWIEKDRHRVVKRAETSETRLILRRLCSLASSLSVQLDVAIPCLQESPDGLFSYPLLPGNPPNPQKDNSALISYETSLGSLLAKLHNLGPNSLPLPQATDPCTSLASMLETVHAAFTLPGHLADTAHRLLEGNTWAPYTTLIHGDLHEGNILVQNGEITAILDWASCRTGDPGEDFFFHLMGYGTASLKRLLDVYRHHGGHTWPRMDEHIALLLATYPIRYAAIALQSGNPTLLAAAQNFLEMPPDWPSVHHISLSGL